MRCGSPIGRRVIATMGTRMEDEVIRLIAEACDVNPEDVQRDRLLVEYGLDSARAMDLVVGLEDAFQVQISDEVASKLRKVDDVIRFVCERAPR